MNKRGQNESDMSGSSVNIRSLIMNGTLGSFHDQALLRVLPASFEVSQRERPDSSN